MWFSLICRVAVKVLQGGTADDVRSDDEDEEIDISLGGDEKIALFPNAPEVESPFEEEVGVEAISLKGRPSNVPRFKKSTSATGVSLPSDRKELLGRIGCDHSGA